MKILQLVQKPQRRGAEVFALQLSQTLRQQGHEVCANYLYPYTGDRPLPFYENDAQLHGQETHFFEKLPGVHPALLRKLIRNIETFRPQVVQVNGARTVKYGAFAKRFSRYKDWVIVYRNIDDPYYWVTDPLRRIFYKKLVMPQIDGVVGVSRATLDNVKALYGLKSPSTFIPNGVDPIPLQSALSQEKARRQLGVLTEIGVVLFMGSLSTQKRPDRFVRVMRQVYDQFPKVEAWILGDGPLKENIKNMVCSLGIQCIVRFWGYQAEIASYIAASDLLLVTSDSDGIPAVILEAGLLGKPSVAAQVGGISDCVLDGKTGILASPQDEEGLAGAVLHLLKQPEQRLEMGRRALAWMRANFTIDIIARRYFDFYRQVLAQFHQTLVV